MKSDTALGESILDTLERSTYDELVFFELRMDDLEATFRAQGMGHLASMVQDLSEEARDEMHRKTRECPVNTLGPRK